MKVSACVALAILINFTQQACLSNGDLKSLGLISLSAAEDYSSGDPCSTFYKETKAKTCADLDYLKKTAENNASHLNTNYTNEHFEIYANLDSIFNDFVDGFVEISSKGTYKSKMVSSTVKTNYTQAYDWIEKYSVGDKNISTEVEACSNQQQQNAYGAYCILSSDLGSNYLGECSTIQSKNVADSGQNTSSSTNATQEDVDKYNSLLDQSQTNTRILSSASSMKFNISEESAAKIVDSCANSVRALCLYYKMQTAISSAEGKGFPQDLKNKCNEAFLKCASKVPDQNGTVQKSDTCNNKEKTMMVKEFFGGFTNQLIPTATRIAMPIKASTELARQNLFGKLQNKGFGSVAQDTTVKADTGSNTFYYYQTFISVTSLQVKIKVIA